MKKNIPNIKIESVVFTRQEIYDALRVPPPYRDRKKYYKKEKHKGRSKDWPSLCSKFGYLKYCSYIYGIIKNNKGYGTMAIQ
jgi:hypothetical protein